MEGDCSCFCRLSYLRRLRNRLAGRRSSRFGPAGEATPDSDAFRIGGNPPSNLEAIPGDVMSEGGDSPRGEVCPGRVSHTDAFHLEMAGRISTRFSPTGEATPDSDAFRIRGSPPSNLKAIPGVVMSRRGYSPRDEVCSADRWAGDPDGNELLLDLLAEDSERGNGAFMEDEGLRKMEFLAEKSERGNGAFRAFMEDEVPRKMWEDSWGANGESGRPYRYDVFLSFRGEDTRNGFTGHLHEALDKRGIGAFMDEEELQKGEEIAPAILGAIGESRISIVVFSENYASSSWCLDELVRIVECRDTMGQIVWPVFYNVDPSEVRKHSGRYGQALIDHEERLKSNSSDLEKVKRWREALTAAANISGWPLVDERESDVIKKIVTEVCTQLKNRKQLYVPENAVAMDSHVHRMRTLLDMESNEVRMVGKRIWRNRKTTIAKATYNAFVHKFEYCSFLSNVRETCEKFADKWPTSASRGTYL